MQRGALVRINHIFRMGLFFNQLVRRFIKHRITVKVNMMIKPYFIKHILLLFVLFALLQIWQSPIAPADEKLPQERLLKDYSPYKFSPQWVIDSVLSEENSSSGQDSIQRYKDIERKKAFALSSEYESVLPLKRKVSSNNQDRNYGTVNVNGVDYPAVPAENSVLLIPLNHANGGIDVNILDWMPSADPDVTSYRIYRRVFGTTEWTLIHDNGEAIRYFDPDIDTNTAYQYEVRAYTGEVELAPVQLNRSVNYTLPDSNGLQPENVLVLVNTDPGGLGYVDIASPVNGYESADGRLDPITESQLMTYLGYQLIGGVWKDAGGNDAWQGDNGNGEAVLMNWHIIKHADGSIEAPLGVYYAIRRGIPKENIVFVDNVPTAERPAENQANFDALIRTIHDAMVSRGIASRITSVVSAYHFPLARGGHTWLGVPAMTDMSWEWGLNTALWASFTGDTNPLSVVLNTGHHFSRYLGDSGFMTTRIDAADIVTARRMVDDAIWAEANYTFNDPDWVRTVSTLRALIDWHGKYADVDAWFQQAASLIGASGFFGDQGTNWDSTPDITAQWIAAHPQYDLDADGRLDNTFLFTGWYHVNAYQDMFNWARGAIGWSLDSLSAASFRDGGSSWGANIISHGAVASLGAVHEPGVFGHTAPDYFMYYLLAGYSFAEAAYQANAGSQMAFNGDPLYNPFRAPNQERIVQLEVQGQQVVRYILGRGPLNRDRAMTISAYLDHGGVTEVYRDYDLNGRLVREQLNNGVLIEYLADGRTVVYEEQNPRNSPTIPIIACMRIYDAHGALLSLTNIPGAGPSANFLRDELRMMEDGSIRVYRFWKDQAHVDVFNQEGLLLTLDPVTQEAISYDIVESLYENQGGFLAIRYIEIGSAVFGPLTRGAETRQVISRIEYTDGSWAELVYEPGSFAVREARYYNVSGVLISTLTRDPQSGDYSLRDEASGMSIARIRAPSLAEFCLFLKEAPQYALNNSVCFNRAVTYLMTAEGLSREEALGQISLNPNQIISRRAEFKYDIMRSGQTSVWGNFQSPNQSQKFIRPFRITSAGLTITASFNDAGQLTYLYRIPTPLPNSDFERRRSYAYFNDASGNVAGYEEQSTNRMTWNYIRFYSGDPVQGAPRLVGEYIIDEQGYFLDNFIHIYVGYPDKGFASIEEAAAFIEFLNGRETIIEVNTG